MWKCDEEWKKYLKRLFFVFLGSEDPWACNGVKNTNFGLKALTISLKRTN